MSKTKEELILSLNNTDENERLYAVEDILDSDYKDLSVELVKRLKIEKSSLIKNSIISVLQKMETQELYKELFDLFPDEDPFLRNSAVSIFSSFGENSVHFLSSYIDHSNKEVRKLVLDSIVEIALKNPSTKSSVIEILRAHLYDPEINIVITAVEYLGKLEDTFSIQEFINIFHSTNQDMLHSTILDVVTKIGNKETITPIISSLLTPEILNNSLYYSYIIILLAISDKTKEFQDLLEKEKLIEIYPQEFIQALEIFLKNGSMNLNLIKDYICELMDMKNISEEVKFSSVNLLLHTKHPQRYELISRWSKEGSSEFQGFCKEILETQGIS